MSSFAETGVGLSKSIWFGTSQNKARSVRPRRRAEDDVDASEWEGSAVSKRSRVDRCWPN